MTSLCFASALDIAAQLRRRELSAVECLEYFRARVERLNPALNAIVVFDWQRAYEAIDSLQLDEERARMRLAWREFFREWDIVRCPIGLQAIGDSHADLQTIEFAQLVTAELRGFRPAPGLH